eukprot:2046981-Rhodomonas_salina.3
MSGCDAAVKEPGTRTYELRYQYTRAQVPGHTSSGTRTYELRYQGIRAQVPGHTSSGTRACELRAARCNGSSIA